LVSVIVVVFFTGTSLSAERVKLPSFFAISGYDIGSSAYITTSMALEGITQHTGQKFRLLPQGTGVARVSALRAGAAHFMSTGSEGIFCSAGKEDFAGVAWGPQDLRIVWAPAITGIPVMVRGDSGIKKIADLKGKKLPYAVGSAGMNIQVEANLAFGNLTWNDVEIVKVPSYTAACEGVLSGLVVGYAVAPTSIYTTRLEASPHGIGYIPLPFDDEEGWKRARAVFPFWSKYEAVVGGGLSKEKPLQTATYPNPLLSTYANQDPDLVYWMVKNLVEAYPIFSKKAEIMQTNWTLEWNLKLTINCAIPTHPGAIRYYKEIGKWTPELEAHNQETLKNKAALIELWKEALREQGIKKVKDADFPAFWEKMRSAAGPKYAW
jgi:TRAP transporter TAXI family solute receptor